MGRMSERFKAEYASGIFTGKYTLRIVLLVLMLLGIGMSVPEARAKSNRVERRAITAGNKLYREGKFAEAIIKYNEALTSNSASAVAKFNIAMSRMGMAEKMQQTDTMRQHLMDKAIEGLTEVAKMGAEKAGLASKANYNLGNLCFNRENYGDAIKLYKQALRLNPDFNEARRNLRIAQLRQQKNEGNGGDRNEEDKKEQEQQQQQNQQDQQNQQNQQDRQQNQDKDKEQQPPRENEINPQAASQILNAVENKEAATRARRGTNEGKEKAGSTVTLRKW